MTFKDHTQVVWDVKFNDTGEFLGSCSMDQSVKIWDLNAGKCKHSLRGHVDSVNALNFINYTNLVLTCSGDKTISVWDMRTTHCAQTYLGHKSSINSVAINNQNTMIGSVDSDGNVYLWDYRMAKEYKHEKVSDHDLNKIEFEKSGHSFVTCGNDKVIRLFTPELELKRSLTGHEDSVLDVTFD